MPILTGPTFALIRPGYMNPRLIVDPFQFCVKLTFALFQLSATTVKPTIVRFRRTRANSLSKAVPGIPARVKRMQ